MEWNDKLINENKFTSLSVVIFVLITFNSIETFATDNATASQNDTPVDFFSQLDVKSSIKDDSSWLQGENWQISGFLNQKFVYSLEKQVNPSARRDAAELSQSRSTVDMNLDGKIFENSSYRISSSFNKDVYETWDDGFSVVDEVFINIDLGNNFWLKEGRQVIAWGQSDYTQMLDQANPREIREIGVVEAEDLRTPIWATKLSKVGERWGFDLALIHEFVPNRLAEEGDDFDPFVALRSNFTINKDSDPESGFDNSEVLVQTFYSFSKGDLSFIYADVYDDSPSLKIGASANQLLSYHQKIKVFGFAGNLILDSWLLKTEIVQKNDVQIRRDTVSMGRLTEQKSVKQLMLGTEYTLNGDSAFAFEWVAERIQDYEEILSPVETDTSFIATATFDFLNDMAKLSVRWAQRISGKSNIYSINYDYNLSDTTKLSCSYLSFDASDQSAQLYNYRNNDQVIVSMRYSF